MVSRVGLVLFVLGATGQVARANPLAIAGGSARSIGRAGVGTVGDDGGGALQVNPGALARRDTLRLQLGIAFDDDALRWRADAADAPVSSDQGRSNVLPQLSLVGAIGDWVIGGAVMTAGASDHAFRDPSDIANVDQLGVAFEYRYAGVEGALRRDTVMLGVARRVGDSLAVGVSAGLSRITMSETRRMWVGFAGASGGFPVGYPNRDLQLTLDGDAYVPSAVVGALFAPVDTPLELALSVGWVKYAAVKGDLVGQGVAEGPILGAAAATAQVSVRQPVAVRAGVRYVGDRITAELDGDLWIASDAARTTEWRIKDARVADRSSVTTNLAHVPSRLSLRTHGAVRGAVDVELVAGFLYATAGYAYTMGSTPAERLSPTFGDLGGHTIAVGIEGTASAFTYTIGWSRTLSTARRRTSELMLDNPFMAGDATVPRGTYDGSIDQVGILLDVEIPAP